jgi:glycosyltransferase involved in cell wall biosynthesis
MLLSIVIPTIGRSCLQTVVDYALSVERPNIQVEVIVVNDCVTRNPIVLKEDSRVKIIEGPREGSAGAARNAGISRAGGEWIQFCDDDDFLHPNTGEWLNEVLHELPLVDTVVWRAVGFFDHLSPDFPIPPAESTSLKLGLVTLSFCIRNQEKKLLFSPTKVVGDGNTCEDFDYLVYAVNRGDRVAFGHRLAYGYRYPPPAHHNIFPIVLLKK